MAVPTPPDRIHGHDGQNGDVSYIRTDSDLPPVAIIDRSPITVVHRIIFGIIAVVGAIAWAVIAFVRGETVNAVWFVIAAICTYVIGYRFYARLIEMKIVRPRDDHATPAEVLDNGTDYVPTDRRVLFGHHFAAIAGAGPLVGPVLATQMGYLPGTIWIIIGAVFAGCVQDYLVLWISTRRRGRSLGQMARDELGALGRGRRPHRGPRHHGHPDRGSGADRGAGAGRSPWGVFSIAMTIPIALFMGCYLRFLRPGRVSESIGDRLRAAAAAPSASGNWVAETSWGASWFTLSPVTLSLVPGRLRFRRVGAAGVAAARAARLPVDVHEGRHDRAAGDRHLHRAPGYAGARGLAFRHPRRRSGVRRLAVPVPVHHHRVRRPVRVSTR